MEIHLCPDCKQYLAPGYKFCVYCGTDLQGRELLIENIKTAGDEEKEEETEYDNYDQ
jgi:exonuclease VII small subunit